MTCRDEASYDSTPPYIETACRDDFLKKITCWALACFRLAMESPPGPRPNLLSAAPESCHTHHITQMRDFCLTRATESPTHLLYREYVLYVPQNLLQGLAQNSFPQPLSRVAHPASHK